MLGTNAAAQVHAESARDGCFTGHWGSDGTTPEMRYALAGGYQVNAENMTGLNYCIQPYENLQRIADLESAVRDAANGLMDSPDHYHIATAGQFKKVNLGIAWDTHIIWLVQQFEGGYVQFQRLPELKGTQLAFSGRTANGAKTGLDQNGLKVDIYYQPLGLLTRGQLASGYCLDVGEVLGTLIPPAPSGYSYGDLAAVPKTYERCHSPYQTSPTAKAPASYLEAKSQHDLSRILPNLVWTHPVHFVITDRWDVDETSFYVSADIEDVLDIKGSGVYQLILWGSVNGITRVIADYWVFHKEEIPDNYGGT